MRHIEWLRRRSPHPFWVSGGGAFAGCEMRFRTHLITRRGGEMRSHETQSGRKVLHVLFVGAVPTIMVQLPPYFARSFRTLF